MATYIVYALLLALIQIWIIPMVLNQKNMSWMLSSRDEAADASPLLARARRASSNLQESLPAFLALALLSMIVDDERIEFIPKRTPTNNFTSNWDTDFFNILEKELNSEQPDAIVMPFMTIGGTDSQFFQAKGVNCYGLIPILVAEEDIQTMHGIDERLSIKNLSMGTKIVYKTVKRSCKN